MSKTTHAVGASLAVLAACLFVPLAASSAGPPDAVCPSDTFTFTGTARDLVVPAGTVCTVTGATITRDLVVRDGAGAEVSQTSIGRDVAFGEEAGADISQSTVGRDVLARGADSGAGITDSSIGRDFVGQGDQSGADILSSTVGHDVRLTGSGGGLHLESVAIGHDLYAAKPQTIQTGHNSPDTPGGPVNVGHDFTIVGSPDLPFVFDGICNLTVGRDLRITDRTVDLGIGLGAFCRQNGEEPNVVGRDLVLTGDSAASGFFGPSSIQVGFNRVGRDLVFSRNTAAAGGTLEVSGNAVARNATCADNSPAATAATPNAAGGANTCG